MARYVQSGEVDGRPGGGNGKNKDVWGKGQTDGSSDGDHLQGLKDIADLIDGMAGDDNINGYSGNDTIVGGDGADNLTPGEGADVVVLGTHTAFEAPFDHNDNYAGDEDDDTVTLDVSDDPQTEEGDVQDLIYGYEGAVDVGEGEYETHDVIELEELSSELLGLGSDADVVGDPGSVGDVVDELTAAELESFLWVDEGGLVYDADGGGAGTPEDDNLLAHIYAPSTFVDEDFGYSQANAEGITVQFEAEREVVASVDEGLITGTTTETVEITAVWNGSDWVFV